MVVLYPSIRENPGQPLPKFGANENYLEASDQRLAKLSINVILMYNGENHYVPCGTWNTCVFLSLSLSFTVIPHHFCMYSGFSSPPRSRRIAASPPRNKRRFAHCTTQTSGSFGSCSTRHRSPPSNRRGGPDQRAAGRRDPQGAPPL